MEPILLIFAGAIVFAVLYYFMRKRNMVSAPNGSDNAKPDVFEFEADPPGVAAPLTLRKIRILAPKQRGSNLQIERLPLPGNIPSTLEKQGKSPAYVIACVINPRIRLANDKEITKFDPPLTVTVFYNDQDIEQSTLKSDGSPQLSLVTYYEADGIRWERLDTTVDSGAKTLTATISVLEPEDPILECRP